MIGRKRRTRNAEDPTPNLHGKRRRHSIVAFEMVRLDRAAAEPLHQQLYRQIRDELASGSFNNNSSRLPSSRALATDFGVSRFTVNLALSRLHAEGYLQSKIGSGTFISEALPETFLSARTTKAAPPTERPSRLSNRVKDIPDHRAGKQFDFGIAGPPASPLFQLSPPWMNFPSKFGNDSEHKFSHKKERICSSMRQAVAIPSCARRWQLICAITEARAAIQIKSSSPLERSRQ
jgi:Transcriptional regulators